MHSTKILALLSAPSTSALAADVYSYFLTNTNAQIGLTDYDVSSDGCFSVSGAAKLKFSQAGLNTNSAAGPYCLHAFSDEACGTEVASQRFANVAVDDNTVQYYALDTAVANAAHYKWTATDC